jgi:hypothetical protein
MKKKFVMLTQLSLFSTTTLAVQHKKIQSVDQLSACENLLIQKIWPPKFNQGTCKDSNKFQAPGAKSIQWFELVYWNLRIL